MASIFGHIFDWILEHVIYPIMTLGKVDRDWDNNDSWNHQSSSWVGIPNQYVEALDGYKEELKPVFKSTTSQFMTTIYSVEYDTKGNEIVAKPEINKEQVGR